MSGMTMAIWPGERPFDVASWISPARRNIPVRATSDIKKTFNNSAKIIRLTMPKYTKPPSFVRAAEQPPDRIDYAGKRLLCDAGCFVAAEVPAHADAVQVSADSGGNVSAPAQ